MDIRLENIEKEIQKCVEQITYWQKELDALDDVWIVWVDEIAQKNNFPKEYDLGSRCDKSPVGYHVFDRTDDKFEYNCIFCKETQ